VKRMPSLMVACLEEEEEDETVTERKNEGNR
jgi:hypothetical protein